MLLLLVPTVGLMAAAGAFLAFALGLSAVLRRADGLDCGCFGAFMPSRISGHLIVRNLALALCAFGVLALQPDRHVRGTPLVDLLLGVIVFLSLLLATEWRQMVSKSLPRLRSADQ